MQTNLCTIKGNNYVICIIKGGGLMAQESFQVVRECRKTWIRISAMVAQLVATESWKAQDPDGVVR